VKAQGQRSRTYRLVTLWVSALRVNVLSLLTSAILGASGAAFWVSSIEKSMLVVKYLVMVMAASGELDNVGGWLWTKDAPEDR
jgi:hypothetical protein